MPDLALDFLTEQIRSAYNVLIAERGYLIIGTNEQLRLGSLIKCFWIDNQVWRVISETDEADARVQIDIMARELGYRWETYLGEHYYRIITD